MIMSKTLRHRRIEEGWTLEKLGKLVGGALKSKPVKPQVVADWERTGRCHPKIVPALAKVFKITSELARETMEATEAEAGRQIKHPAAAE